MSMEFDWLELHQILRTMSIPKQRMDDIFWLNRNIAFQNSGHVKFDRAVELINNICEQLRHINKPVEETPFQKAVREIQEQRANFRKTRTKNGFKLLQEES